MRPLLFVLSILGFTSRCLSQIEFYLDYNIDENQPSGLQIGHISNDVQHSISIQSGRVKRIFNDLCTYRFRNTNEFFSLDPKSSVLKTAKTIDLEKLCPRMCNESGFGILHLIVIVYNQNNQLQGMVNVKIVITDQNDNVPSFPMKVFQKKIKEILYGVGKIIELPKAIDNDVAPLNNKIEYELSKISDTFRLHLTNDSQPRLRLIRDIDYEERNKYSLTLIAWNAIRNKSKSYLQIKIEVVDMNDCQPKFEKRLLEVVVDENAKIGKIITKLRATDRDRNSQLQYGMPPSATASIQATFSVRPNGEVVLQRSLDVEQEWALEVPVTASDGEFTDSAKLRVLIRDVNNHAPSYSLNPARLSIHENQAAKMLVGKVTVMDKDSTIVNGEVRCREPQGQSNIQWLTFQPNPAQNPAVRKYDVFSRVSLDREEASVRLVYLICHDGGLHGRLTSTLTISLHIVDVNDNGPQFEPVNYMPQIREANNIGDKLIQVKANDKDKDKNAEISYIFAQPSPPFSIDSRSGWISVMRVLDREDCALYHLTILATNPIIHSNSGIDSLAGTATATVNVTVLDVNDNPPRILAPLQFNLPENAKPHSLIGQVNARDDDANDNARLYFSLVSKHHGLYFDVRRNGTIFSKMSFDRETESRYCLNVRVTDLGLPIALSATGTVCVTILDVNDNAPVISVTGTYTFPPSATAVRPELNSSIEGTILASVHDIPGQKIAVVTATDADADENAKCSFMLQDIDDPTSGTIDSTATSLFVINEEDGSIKIGRVMSRDNIGQYRVRVVAQDRGKTVLSSDKTIIIEIHDLPPRASSRSRNVKSGSFQLSGNVLIVIILSTVSACLTALLIGAILCMIRPCCYRSSVLSASRRSTTTASGHLNGSQSLADITRGSHGYLLEQPPSGLSAGGNNFHKLLPPDIYNNYDSNTWKDSSIRAGSTNYDMDYYSLALNNESSTLGAVAGGQYKTLVTSGAPVRGDYFAYDMAGNVCCMDHVIGKPSGCACGQGACTRYGNSHNSMHCLLSPGEEQCSDSGRGASDDDMKNNVSGLNVSRSSNAMANFNFEQRSRSPWIESYHGGALSTTITITPNPTLLPTYSTAPNTNPVQIPLSTFQPHGFSYTSPRGLSMSRDKLVFPNTSYPASTSYPSQVPINESSSVNNTTTDNENDDK